MENARMGRMEQLMILKAYEGGKTVMFRSHQGKTPPMTYEPEMDSKPEKEKTLIGFDKVALLFDATRSGDEETVGNLLKDGVDPNSRDAEGMTPLHQCCIENNLKIASLLILNGANVNARDNDWWTPLHAVAACGHWRLCNFLLSHSADATAVNADGELALDIVEGDKCKEVLTEELNRLGFDSDEKKNELRDKEHMRLLAFVKKLVAEKGDLNGKDKHGVAPIHVASSNGWLDVLQLLLEGGADVNLPDPEENTPAHLAVFFLQYKALELLGKHGANMDAQNHFGEIPIVLTEDITMMRLAKALKEHQNVDQADIDDAVKRSRLNSKRRSLSFNKDLTKNDHEIEHNMAAGPRPPSGDEEEDATVEGLPPVPMAAYGGSEKKEEKKEEAKEREGEKPEEKNEELGQVAAPRKKADVDNDPKNKSKNPKFINRDSKRKGSLAAIAVDEQNKKKGCCSIS